MFAEKWSNWPMSRLVWKIIQMKMARAIHLEAGRKCQHSTMICPKNRGQKDERGDQIGPRTHDVQQKVIRFFVNLTPTVHRQLGISHLLFLSWNYSQKTHILCNLLKVRFSLIIFSSSKICPCLRGLLNYTCVTWKV